MTSDNGSSFITDTAQDWSLHRRVAVPDPVPGYFDRPALTERLLSADHRMAVLKAPGGFGKTALLAAYCRRLGRNGVAVAWMRIDAAVGRSNIETHLACAFRHAGVHVPDPGPDGRRAAGDRIELLLNAIAAYAEPVVLVLDNLEQLADPASVGALNTLLRDAPPNLNVTLACRELPFSLDIAEPLLEGRIVMLTAAELRFSPQEAAAFLGRYLTRQEFTAIDRQFEGWPIALALHRETGHGSTSAGADSSNLLGNWIESRLWNRLTTDQRNFLLDAGLLDRLDPVLLDEVLDCNDSRYRMQALPGLEGLVRFPRGGGTGAAVLHPLLRRHCTERRIRETPERFQAIHHRAALTLERRGEIIESMRHAAEAGDPELLGRLIEDAGGLRLWARQIQPPLEEVVALLTHDVIKRWPRLALTYCFVLIVTDRIPEARRLYELAAASSDGFTRNPTGEVRELRIDQFFVDMSFFFTGYTPFSSAKLRSAVAGAYAIARDVDLEPVTRVFINFGLCIYENHGARFDAMIECIKQVRYNAGDSQHNTFSLHIDVQLGAMAMAQGHVQEAETCYTSALRTARTHCPDDPMAEVISDALLRELQFERNLLSLPVAAGMRIRENITRPGNTFATFVSECAIVTEITQYVAGVDEALAVLTEMMEYARLTKRQTLVRCLVALRVDVLACAGRADEAERAWRVGALPANDADCLDLRSLEWREMERIACARLRLYVACEAFETGRGFAQQVLGVAMKHKLVRTAMRVLAISMVLELRAGDTGAACAHARNFLQYYTTSDYAHPLVREGDAGREVLESLLESEPRGSTRSAAADLLKMMAAGKETGAVARFTDREIAVLKLLPHLRDKQIAAELSITREGVRYHLRRIFAKLGADNRRAAVQTARSIGLL